MSDLKKYEGVIPAFYACYDDQGEVSPERTRALVQYFIDKGVQGLYVNGSSGECIYQSVEDRKLILEEVMAVAKGKLTIIAHVACNNTKDSMELARHAESLGVDAIATIPPIYFRLPEYSVAKYWNDISSAAPNTDYVIYNIPQLAGVALTPSLYTEMLKNPRVIGVKNSSMPVQDIQTFVSLGGEDHIVFNGPDEQFLGGRLMGARAGIGGTYGAMPELFLKLNQLIADKDLETARELQYAINAIIGKLTSAHGNMYGVIKEVMSDLKKYEGVIPAFYACYDDQGEVSPERTRALVQYFIDKGVQGLYVNGSSGECIYQSVEDRKLILEEVMAVAKDKLTIIAHVACNNTKDSMELARHAESLGVDAIATIPPIYFRLPEYSVAKYWNDISSAAPNTDYVIYNIPQLAGVALTPSLYTEMLKNPRVIGVKNSSMPVQDIQTFVSLGGEDHIVFNGPDEQFLGGRLMGARAGIGGTYGAMPELFLKLNQLIADKDLETARELQYAINAIIGKLTSAHGNMYGVIKEVLKINEGLTIGSVRSPLTPVTEEDRPVVEEAAALIRETKERFL
ncbi:N-acetylneuraminate lyase [Streptococcus pneumoniae]|nr:N-acetylneuraminate lyase [Streptococcus pneumoniae]